VVTGAVSGTTPLRVLSRIDPAKYLPASEVPAYNGHNIVWDFAAPRAMVLEFLRSDGQALTAP
jgi:hypothetical protein